MLYSKRIFIDHYHVDVSTGSSNSGSGRATAAEQQNYQQPQQT